MMRKRFVFEQAVILTLLVVLRTKHTHAGCETFTILYSYQPLIVAPNQVFGGWREGLLQMKEGDKWEFYMTVDEQQAAAIDHLGAVSAGFVLIYTFELLEVETNVVQAELIEVLEVDPLLSGGFTIDGISLEGSSSSSMEWLEEKKDEEGVITLPSGLM
jgi:hypothetical protein